MARRSEQLYRLHNPTDSHSQEVLALSHLLKQPTMSKETHELRSKIITDQKKLGRELEQRMQKTKEGNDRRREELIAAFLEALEQPNREHARTESSIYPGTRVASNTICNSLSGVIGSSEDLVTEYKRLDGIITQVRPDRPGAISEEWKQEIEQVDKRLRQGARVALRNVKKVLGADTRGGKTRTTDEDNDTCMEGEDAVVELNYNLQKTLGYAERGVKRMVKGLPDEAS